MTRWERVWIVEYLANDGRWYPASSRFYDYKHHAIDGIKEMKFMEEKPVIYRAVAYTRQAEASK